MTGVGVDSFAFLQQFWPDLAELGRKAEQVEGREPELVAIRLRGLTEEMLVKLVTIWASHTIRMSSTSTGSSKSRMPTCSMPGFYPSSTPSERLATMRLIAGG